jgi:protoporphyrinogen oxidase
LAPKTAQRRLSNPFAIRAVVGMMWEAAAKKMKAMGGRILMDHALERLTYDEARALWTIEVMRGDGTRETFVANEIVSSAPIRELMSALKPTPLSLLHARELRYRDFLTWS